MEKVKKRSMIWSYIAKYKWQYLIGVLILFVVDSVQLYIPQFTGEITDGLKQHTIDLNGVLLTVGKILCVGLCIALGRFGWRFFIFGSARKIEYEIRTDLFAHLTKLTTRYFNEHKTGDLMAHFTNDLNAIRMSVGMAVISTFDAVIMTVMVIFKMVTYVNPLLTLLAILPMGIILFGGIQYGKEVEKRFTEKQEAFSSLTDKVQESISGVRVIKAFVQERQELKSFAKANQLNKDKNMRVVKLQAIVMPLLDVLIGISSLVTLLYGGYLVIEGKISTGQFVAFNSYVGMLVWPMIAVGDSIASFSQGRASIRRVQEIFEEEPEVADDCYTNASITNIKGSIECKNLTFHYKEALPAALSSLSVKIEAGKTLAILGRTGSGKTTFANLLVRLYNTKPGELYIDGRDIREIPLSVLREQIAYVPQDNFLFSDTLQANIAFGVRKRMELPQEKRKNKIFMSKAEKVAAFQEMEFGKQDNKVDLAYNDLEQVQKAAKLACIHDNIMDFPNQYSTMVGERGVTVSGGQKQRSAIARALLKDAPILILDDSLSAVDTDTEENILKNLKETRKGKTTILIAHRISTTQNADYILVLYEGTKAEYGTHEQLLALNGIYAKLYEKQQLEKQLEVVEA